MVGVQRISMSQFAQCKGGCAASCFASSGYFACLPFGWLLSAYIVLFPVCARFNFGIQSISQLLLEAHRKSVRKVLESVEFNEDGIMFRVISAQSERRRTWRVHGHGLYFHCS